MSATLQPLPNPYVGPRAFRYGETLYGRDREVIDLVGLLIAERIVLLYSPSGAGKTSLMQAALIPKLENEDFHVLPVMRVSLQSPPALERLPKTNRYVLSVLLSLEEALPAQQQMSIAELAEMKLPDYLAQREAGPDAPRPSVLIFDQFEEILTVDPTDRAAKEAFFAQVGTALRARHRWALFAMREEYAAGLDPYLRPLPTRLRTTFRLELLGEDAACLAMKEPAHQAGVEFTDAAARKLVNDLRRVRMQGPEGTIEELGLHVEPVHLQVVCRRLWERLPADDREIEEQDVEAIGDVDSALAGYYVERVAAIAGETGVSERAIREWFDRQLITAQGIRGQVLQDHERSQGLENRAIARLVDAHLVRAEQRRGATWFELAHDRLIDPVRKNNAVWYQANLSGLQRQADLWERQDRPGGLLLRDQELVEAEQWAADHQDELTDPECDFLEACREARAIAKRERRNNHLIRGLAAVTTLMMLVALYFFFLAEDKAEKAKETRIVSMAQALAAKKQDDQSALLALQAYHLLSKHSWLHRLTKRRQVHMMDQVDDALRTVLSAPYLGHTLSSHQGSVRTVTFSPDGQTLASGGDDKTVRLWALRSPNATPTVLRGHEGPVLAVAFSPDGQTLASGGDDKTVRLWAPGSPNATPTVLRGHEGPVLAVAFSPERDSKTLATGSGTTPNESRQYGTVRLWELSNPTPTVLGGHTGLALHTKPVRAVAFSPDGRTLASGSADKTIVLWDVATKAPLDSPLTHHDGWVMSVAFSPDGRTLASGSADKTIVLWDVATKAPLDSPLTHHDGWVMSVAFSPDGQTLASGSWDRTVRLWELGNPNAAPTVLRSHTGLVLSVAFSPDKKGQTLASGSDDKTVRLWEQDNATVSPIALSGPKGSKDSIRAVAFSPDGKTLAAGTWSRDGAVQLWELGNPNAAPIALPGHHGRALSVAFSLDGKTLAAGSSDNLVRLWNLENLNAPPAVLSDHERGISAVAFSPDGQTLAAGSWDKKLSLWKPGVSSTPLTIWPGRQGLILSVGFSPDGQTLAAGGDDKTVRLWSLENLNALLPVLRGHAGSVRAVAFSPKGKILASGSDDATVRLWDLRSRYVSSTVLRGHEGPVESVAFSRDGRTLASGSDDTTIRLWDLEHSGTVRAVLRNHEARVWSVAFSPDEQEETLVSGSDDTHILRWISRHESLATMICKKVRRNLTLEEWHQFMDKSIPYGRTCPNLPIHPSFIEAGRELALAGDVGGAMTLFRRAQTLDPSLKLVPKAEARKFAAEGWVIKGSQVIKEGKGKEAIAAYGKAQKLDATLKIPAKSWETLCWFGSLWGYATDVMKACEQAVMLAPEDYGIRDSRGLARALTGNIDGAIADFQALVDLTPNMEKKARRQRWIETLRAGKNPFTPEELEALR